MTQIIQRLQQFNQAIEQNIWLFGFILVWTMVWKGIALWKSAGLKDKFWFVALFLINTMGVLEILYIFLLSKKKKEITNNTI